MSEFAPAWGTPKMSKAQVKAYIKAMEQKRAQARLELEKAQMNGELTEDWLSLEALEKQLEEL